MYTEKFLEVKTTGKYKPINIETLNFNLTNEYRPKNTETQDVNVSIYDVFINRFGKKSYLLHVMPKPIHTRFHKTVHSYSNTSSCSTNTLKWFVIIYKSTLITVQAY